MAFDWFISSLTFTVTQVGGITILLKSARWLCFVYFADLCGERIPRELYYGGERRVTSAAQASPVIHFQRLHACTILHRRRQLLCYPAAAADRRPLLILSISSQQSSEAPRHLANVTANALKYVHAIIKDAGPALCRDPRSFSYCHYYRVVVSTIHHSHATVRRPVSFIP